MTAMAEAQAQALAATQASARAPAMQEAQAASLRPVRPPLFAADPAGDATSTAAVAAVGAPPGRLARERATMRLPATAAVPAQAPATDPALLDLLGELVEQRATSSNGAEDETNDMGVRGATRLERLERAFAAHPEQRTAAFERTLREKFAARRPAAYVDECTDLRFNKLLYYIMHLVVQVYDAMDDPAAAKARLVGLMIFLDQANLDQGKVDFAQLLSLAPEPPPVPDAGARPKRDRRGRQAFSKLAERPVVSAALAAQKEWSQLAKLRSELE